MVYKSGPLFCQGLHTKNGLGLLLAHGHGPVMIVLTVTPIDHLHKSDGPNGVKGAAEEDKK